MALDDSPTSSPALGHSEGTALTPAVSLPTSASAREPSITTALLPQADHSLAHSQQRCREVSLTLRTPGMAAAAGAAVLELAPQARVAARGRAPSRRR